MDNISNKSLDELLELVEENIDKFIENIDDFTIYESIIKYANDKYYNENENVLFDDTYDILIDKLKELHPKSDLLNQIGASVKQDTKKIILPYHMGSMDKIKSNEADKINKWKLLFKGPYMIHNKLDGISGLLIVNKNRSMQLYTRGNGTIGTDISNIIDYINIQYIDNIINYININNLDKIIFRGELIMQKSIFYTKYASMPSKNNKFPANPRNFVSGLVSAKLLNTNALSDVDFVFYEIVEPWTNIYEQYKTFDFINLNSAKHFIATNDKLNIENLIDTLHNERLNYQYEIDGLIISDTNDHIRNIEKNPDYSFAFKIPSDIVEAFVNNVIWDISKDGYMIPVVNIVPTKLSGVTISNVTAFNGKYIYSNNINIGTIIKITRSGEVIPYIVDVIKPSNTPLLPNTIYKWSKSGVDIINTDPSLFNEQLIKLLTYFIKTLNIKNIDNPTFKALVDNKIINNIYDIFTLRNKENDILKLDGFGEKKTKKILQNLLEGFNNMTLVELMAASNVFGRGFGIQKIKKIIDIYPDIILETKNDDELIKLIDNIEGFDYITSKQFVDNLQNFNVFLENIPKDIKNRMFEMTIHHNITNKLINEKIAFSGFRNNEWKNILEKNGATVSDTLTKSTNILVVKYLDDNSIKIQNAKKWNIKILSINEFTEYILNTYNISLN